MTTKKISNGAWFDVLTALVQIEVIPNKAHRILLYGPPGTGKSSWASTCFATVERITLHGQMPPDDLIGSMGLVSGGGGTATVWQDGPVVRAMRNGSAIVLDEIDKASPDVVSSLFAVLDDMPIAGVTLPTGERVIPSPGYCAIATSNQSPDVLPEALRNRFDLVLLANVPHADVLRQLPRGWSNLVSRTYEDKSTLRWNPPISLRSVLVVHRLASLIDLESATELVFGSDAKDILASAAVNK